MALYEDIITFCKRELNIPQDVLVSIEQIDLSEDNVHGWTTDSAEDDAYDIEIDTGLGFKEAILTVCHEMVHVKQFLRKELSSNGMRWKGLPNPNTKSPTTEPHEVEAYKLEKVLYQKCVDLKLI